MTIYPPVSPNFKGTTLVYNRDSQEYGNVKEPAENREFFHENGYFFKGFEINGTGDSLDSKFPSKEPEPEWGSF
jgi:hypothetical protein